MHKLRWLNTLTEKTWMKTQTSIVRKNSVKTWIKTQTSIVEKFTENMGENTNFDN